MLIRLEAWAARKFDPAPSINTLRGWANAGLISPPAVKVGRSWMVEEDAEYCPSAPDVQGASDRVLSIYVPRDSGAGMGGGGMIAALYVETDGVYFGLPDVDPWDEGRDARKYSGPYPVVAHPPCQRWGRYWHGAPNKPWQYRLGEDGGCFAAALTAVRNYGGVLEHPAHSHAWRYFGLQAPSKTGGWEMADGFCGWTCHVEQGHYGHMSRKATWLYAVGGPLPSLKWGESEQRIHPVALERYGYEKARRIGMMAMVGGKDKTRIRNATPVEFRDVLLEIARLSCRGFGKV